MSNCNSRISVAYAFQLIMIMCNICTYASGLGRIQNAQKAFLFYNSRRVMFELFGSREQGYSPESQRACCALGDCGASPWDAGDELVLLRAVERSKTVEEALRYLASFMFISLHLLVENSQLYVLKAEARGIFRGNQVSVRKRKVSCGVLGVRMRAMEDVAVRRQRVNYSSGWNYRKSGDRDSGDWNWYLYEGSWVVSIGVSDFLWKWCIWAVEWYWAEHLACK